MKQKLVDFNRPNELKNILVRSDAELGGFSTAHMEIESVPTSSSPLLAAPIAEDPSEPSEPSSSPSSSSSSPQSNTKLVGHFHGVLNLDLPPSRPDVVQSGYAMWRTRDQKPEGFVEYISSIVGDDIHWNWEHCTHLLFRVKGDRRKYFVNIQAESSLPTDIYQHRLFLNTPGQWENVLVPLKGFILTNWGVIQQQRSINTQFVKTVGIGLIDKQYGPFSLYIDSIYAINSKYISPEQASEIESKSTPADRLPGKHIPVD